MFANLIILLVGAVILSLVWEGLAGRESFSLPLTWIVLVVGLGAVLFPFYGSVATAVVLGGYAVVSVLAGLAERPTPASDSDAAQARDDVRQPPSPPSDNPGDVAEHFAETMGKQGFELDFSLTSLLVEVDRLLEAPGVVTRESVAGHKNEAALGAYVGETLARLFDGVWQGQFSADNTGINFYMSYVDFGEYRYHPSHFVSYRISNGPGEGTFAEHLERTLPKVRARVEVD